jgi:translation initiation factor 1
LKKYYPKEDLIMGKKNKKGEGGLVYSTDPDFRYGPEEQNAGETPSPREQRLSIRLDTRQRAGKAVTLIDGFMGKEEDMEELGKKLKAFCGTGGSVKDRVIIIQGDQRDKVLQWLLKNEYGASKRN